MNDSAISKAVMMLKQGGVIAYPTESCYGLGCLPDNTEAVERILSIKQRSWEKGLILVADRFDRFTQYLSSVNPSDLELAQSTWPGPATWLFPAKKNCSPLLTGQFDTLAIRVSAHPDVKLLCETLKSAIVSTSANVQGAPTLRAYNAVVAELGSQVNFVLPGNIGKEDRASEIRDLISNKVIRAA